MHSIRKLTAIAVTAGALAAPASAAADSIVYTRGHNIWLADGDGGSQYQVTTDGTAENPWRSPSQADDGTIVAARAKPNGGPLHRLRQNGDVINQIPLPAMQAGPFDPAVSPDGALIAYEHTFARYVNGWLETGSDIRYARADGSGGTEQWPGVSTGATAPSWIDNGRTLVGRGSVAFTQQPGSASQQWWSDYDHYGIFGAGGDLSDGETAGGRVAMIRGGAVDGNTVVVYDAAGGIGATPGYLCTIGDPAAGPNGRRFADPTLSADGRRVYTQQGDGIYVAVAPAGNGCDGWTERRVIDGGAEPDWGPANVNPGPRTPVGGGGGGGGTSPAPAPAPAPAPVRTPTAPSAPSGTRAPARAPSRAANRCARLKGAKRTACLKQVKRAQAIARCKRTKKAKALTRCVRAAKRSTR
ncbi:hypothetical protein VSS74_25470 [Conexibacter stalactiti]|uniref:WD40 repeat protein n=1 Tax=Conexibacter stalactiti TaxID=1940611 RepID=A0ABU4HYF0_9ACTN|nr:hypothetical protein [Conexibacter stalactiti]MDW5597727.1 hypothetical protein [Conexibacter stalactiti]MEC5038369.1 hypothetical protein [Conexibacter stalactiti]